jgi:hypothetical protein
MNDGENPESISDVALCSNVSRQLFISPHPLRHVRLSLGLGAITRRHTDTDTQTSDSAEPTVEAAYPVAAAAPAVVAEWVCIPFPYE